MYHLHISLSLRYHLHTTVENRHTDTNWI